MICVGNAILDADYINAIRPVSEDGTLLPAETPSETLVVNFSNGEQIYVRASMAEARRELERAGYLKPAPPSPQMTFTHDEVEEMLCASRQGYQYVAKDSTGFVFAYHSRPIKGKATWSADPAVDVPPTQAVKRLTCEYAALSFADEAPLQIRIALLQAAADLGVSVTVEVDC